MIMLHRLFEPPITKFLQHAPDAYRAGDRVAVIGVEGEREIIPDQSPNRARLANIAGDVDVRLGAVVVEAYLYRCRRVLHPRFDNVQHPLHPALALTADPRLNREA